MAQPIKYNTGTTTNGCCIRKGNFDAGIVPTYPYGPTEETDFWAGYDVPVGGFVSYQRKDVQGPSIYQIPNAESIVQWGQHLGLTGNLSTPQDVIQACANTDEIMFTNIEYPNIPLLDNCILLMDAGYTASYPWGGSNWYDISGTLQTTGGTVDVTTQFLSGTTGSSYANSYLLYEGSMGTNVPAFSMGTLNTFTVNIIINTPTILANQNINIVGQRYSQTSGYTAENDCNFLIRGNGNSNTVEGLIRVGGTDYTTAGVDISSFSTTWVALTLTYDGSNLKLYLNGTEQSSSPIGVTPVSNGLDTLIAGSVNGLAPGSSSDYFNGQVNVVNIYNTALDATQVQALYNTYSPRFPAPPVTYNFDVENVDWSTYGVNDQASFEAFIMNNSTYASITADEFNYSPNRIQCNITATGGVSLNLSNFTITNVNSIGGGFDNFRELQLNSNQIVTFNPTTALPNTLETLQLNNNQITNFNPSIALPSSLTTLQLSSNQIVTFNPSIALPSGLITLELVGNQIVTFNPSIALPSGLTALQLHGNDLTSFDPSIALPSGLTILSLYQNQITSFDPSIALPTSLITLDLRNNLLTSFDPTLPLPTSLTTIYLQNNLLTSFDPSIALPTSLTDLNLGSNQISSFDPTLPLPSSLNELVLTGNGIITFNPTIALPSGLSILNLSGNQIVSFNPSLSLPTSLTSFSLQTNQMTTQGYIDSETWATNQPSFSNPCTINFQGNVNSITGTNLATILGTKNVTVLA